MSTTEESQSIRPPSRSHAGAVTNASLFTRVFVGDAARPPAQRWRVIALVASLAFIAAVATFDYFTMISVLIGAIVFLQAPHSLAKAMSHADEAMYEAKAAGRDRVLLRPPS